MGRRGRARCAAVVAFFCATLLGCASAHAGVAGEVRVLIYDSAAPLSIGSAQTSVASSAVKRSPHVVSLTRRAEALRVDGDFDDCQRLVKQAFTRDDWPVEGRLSSANSINVGRLLPQAVFYAVASVRYRERHGTAPGFVVPSGNLGNLCAGLIAAEAGMPHRGFTAATNVSRGFADFLGGAPFEARPSITSVSNAMDVGAPSNLERIRWLYGGDDEALRSAIVGATVSDAATENRIATLYARTGYVLDPHTAVAYESSMRHDASPQEPVVVLGTAHPAKFPDTVRAATGVDVPLPVGLAYSEALEEVMVDIEPEDEALNDVLERLPK